MIRDRFFTFADDTENSYSTSTTKSYHLNESTESGWRRNRKMRDRTDNRFDLISTMESQRLTQSTVCCFVDSIQLCDLKELDDRAVIFRRRMRSNQFFDLYQLCLITSSRPNRLNYVRFNWFALNFMARVTHWSAFNRCWTRDGQIKLNSDRLKNVYDCVKDQREPSI